jgi:Flp pilus assembly protein TadD
MSDEHNAPSPAPGRRVLPLAALALVGVLPLAALALVAVAAALGLARLLLRNQGDLPSTASADFPQDPRLAYRGPLHNVHPDVQYVGDEACAGCHAPETESFRRHPMGRSLSPIASLADRQLYDDKHHNPFEAFDSRFLVDRRGQHVWHRQTRLDRHKGSVYQLDREAHFAVGSGRHGHSYLTLLQGEPGSKGGGEVEPFGYLFQTPISWFSQKQRWDVSPGFKAVHLTGRPVEGECLSCHSNRAHDSEGYQNRYDLPVFDGHAIGCERCHGPGERHVASASPADIVNPRWRGTLAPRERDATCAQCHLEGVVRVLHRGRGLYDFRPGMPLEDFLTVFVRPTSEDAGKKAVTHVEQMGASRCYRESKGDRKLGCVTCHNPHDPVGPERRVEYYRSRCLECHAEHGCSLPLPVRREKSKQDSCIECHMPRYNIEDIPHSAASDHGIPRRPHTAAPAVDGEADQVSRTLLVPFSLSGAEAEGAEVARDRGVALMRAALTGQAPFDLAAGQSLALLEDAVRECPPDVEAWVMRGWALMRLERREQALASFDEALRRAPTWERALVGAAVMADMLRRGEAAEDYWRRAVRVNPCIPAYRKGLTLALRQRQDWQQAREQCRAWMALDPESTEARCVWITCLLHDGNRAEARAAFRQVEALAPANLEALRQWFAQQTR